MKKKIIIIIDVLIAFSVVLCAVFWVIVKAQSEKYSSELESVKQQIKIASNERESERDRISTPDEIAKLKSEIDEKSNESTDTQLKIKQAVHNYIEIVYNTEGDFIKNKNKIINSVSPYVTDNFKTYKLENFFTVNKYSNFEVISKTKRIPNLCSMDDIYICILKDGDGKNIYHSFCKFNFEYVTQYRSIEVDEVNGAFLISADDKIHSIRG